MPATDRSNRRDAITVQGRDLSVQVELDYAPDSRRVEVAYRVSNQGDRALMVFDRGNRQQVLAGRLLQGQVATPAFSQDDGDLTLSHRAMPLPTPAPTVPPTPLATRVEPGGELRGRFEFAPPTAQAPQRLRWCLGVAWFDEQAFEPLGRQAQDDSAPVTSAVWRADFAVVERQQLLCTPWYDLSRAQFADD